MTDDMFPDGECVYAVRNAGGDIKIGWSRTVATRFVDLEDEHGPLRLLFTTPGGRALESWFHADFAAYRLHHEWFSFPPAAFARLQRLFEGADAIPTVDVAAIAARQSQVTAKRVMGRSRRTNHTLGAGPVDAYSADIVGNSEIAVRLGLGIETVRAWHSVGRTDYPAPRWYISGRPAWDWHCDIVPWLERHGRLETNGRDPVGRGRPAKKEQGGSSA